MFHFNKGHLTDPTIPMWVLKTQGQSYYVNHVDCTVPWSTKETPDNPSTKGSIKVKNCLLQIDSDNCATLSELTLTDKVRLHNQKLGITRIIVKEGADERKFRSSLTTLNIKHGPIKSIGGACTSTFYITDILDKSQFSMLALAMSGYPSFRILMPNEAYYRYYDDPRYKNVDYINEDSAYIGFDDDID